MKLGVCGKHDAQQGERYFYSLFFDFYLMGRCVCAMCGAHRGKRGVVEFLELELQALVNCFSTISPARRKYF